MASLSTRVRVRVTVGVGVRVTVTVTVRVGVRFRFRFRVRVMGPLVCNGGARTDGWVSAQRWQGADCSQERGVWQRGS